MTGFVTPPDHERFLAKKLFDAAGEIIDGSIAYLEKEGGGPLKPHTHEHNHLFVVVRGEAKIMLNDKPIIVKENESYYVNGSIPHSVWNGISVTTVISG